MSIKLDPNTVNTIQDLINTEGMRGAARTTGVSLGTLRRALTGARVSRKTATALRRVPPRIRKAADFKRAPRVTPPRTRETSTSWSVEAIRFAIEAQMRGCFAQPKRLADSMQRDDAIFVARSNRIAPISAVATKLEPHASDRGRSIAAKAGASVQVSLTVLTGIERTLVDHGIAIGYVEHEPNADGTRIDMRLIEWPLEHVKYNAATCALETATSESAVIQITHGDGRWIVFRKTLDHPWRGDACILPAGFVWAAHAEGNADWQASSRAHGMAKIMGTMPEGNAIGDTDEAGSKTDATDEFNETLLDVASGDSLVGVIPHGSKAEFIASGSNAWQIFKENILSREKAAARIYQGTDALLGSQGGAPGVDVSFLFGVATTKLQGDFTAIENGLRSGLYEPWAAINYGDSRYAPSWKFLLPDPDRDRKREEIAKNNERLTSTIRARREAGLVVDQHAIDDLAAEYGIQPAPRLASIEAQATTIALAPTDIAKVVRVREARAAQGLSPFGDERDDLTLNELEAWSKAKEKPNKTAPQGIER